MTGWRTWVSALTLVGLCACSEVSAGGSAADSTQVHLGPMPTRPTSPPLIAPPIASAVDDAPPHSGKSPSTRPPNSSSTSTTVAVASTTAVSMPAATAVPATACTHVAYIGDSISLGMVSPETIPQASALLDAQLAAIGVVDLRAEISGGRSIVETLPGQENAHDVAVRLRDEGFKGCWVIAVGTNDAANIAAGGARQENERIAAMMSVVGDDPVLWLDAATVTESGFWAAPNMQAWDAGLVAMTAGRRNVRVVPWSGFVRPEWYLSDGIHLSAAGAAARVQYVVYALAGSFPASGR